MIVTGSFLFASGVLAGWLLWHVGLPAGLGVIVLSVGGATLLDASTLLWRASRETRDEPGLAPVGEVVIPTRVCWRMVQDTCEVSFVVTVLIGGLTYAILLAVALAHEPLGR